MQKADALEAVPICTNALTLILASTTTQGRSGSGLRTAVGDFVANAPSLVQSDQYGAPLLDIFNKAQAAGITLAQLDNVRAKVAALTPVSLGAILVTQTLIQLSLATEVAIVIGMTFVSRNDVTAMQQQMNAAFAPAEIVVADQNQSMLYLALLAAHAAVTAHLAATARPLPRVVDYQFFASYPTLVISYKLYADASRADEVLAENKIVHPAFAPLTGRALST